LKNEDQLVKNSYEMPITRNIFYQCAGNLSTLFDGILPDHIIEMIQAGNVVGVLNALNAEEEISIFEAFRLKKMKRLEELNEDRSDRIEKIKTIKYHLQLLDERIFRYVAQNQCMICKNPFEKIFVLSCCQHLYCGNCVENDCPLCKAKTQEIIKIPLKLKEFDSNESESLKEIKNEKTKIDTLLDIVGTAENKKILIFSNYNETFSLIKKFLDEKKLSYLELRGTKEKRDNAIDSYKTGSVNILLLNTIHSGAGLNLQETSDIILYHRLHEYQKIQVIGRANRIGRKIQLNVHYLE
jgi:SNF2 family DNA or RNA helicase